MSESNVKKKEETEISNKIQKLYDSVKMCFSGPDGVVVLDHLNDVFYGKTTTMCVDRNGRVDPVASGNNEGSRAVVLYIKQLLEASPKYIQDMNKVNIQKLRDQRTGVGPMGRPTGM